MIARARALQLLAAAGAATLPRVTFAQEAVSLKLLSPPSDDVTPGLYALKAGLFRKYGLNVEIGPANSGAATLAALAGGSAQIALSSTLPIVAARARGLTFMIIGPAGICSPEVPYALMLVKKDGPIRTGRDMNGKTIASSSLRDLLAIASFAWIDQNGGDSATVKALELPASAILPAIDDGRIDAATIVSPRLTEAIDSGRVRVLGNSFQAVGRRFLIAGWVATKEFCERNPDVVARFARAVREATAYTNAHHDETVEMMAEYAKLDPKIVAHSTRSLDTEYTEPRDLQPMIDAAVKYKVIERPIDPRELIHPAVLRPAR